MKGEEEEEEEEGKNIPEYRETKKKASSEADVMIVCISRTRQRRHGGARTGSISKYGRFINRKKQELR